MSCYSFQSYYRQTKCYAIDLCDIKSAVIPCISACVSSSGVKFCVVIMGPKKSEILTAIISKTVNGSVTCQMGRKPVCCIENV